MMNDAKDKGVVLRFRRVFVWWGIMISLVVVFNWNNESLAAVAVKMWSCGWLMSVGLFFVRSSLAMPLALSLVSISTIGCVAQLARRVIFLSAFWDSPMGFTIGILTEILFWLIPNLFMLFHCAEFFGWRIQGVASWSDVEGNDTQ